MVEYITILDSDEEEEEESYMSDQDYPDDDSMFAVEDDDEEEDHDGLANEDGTDDLTTKTPSCTVITTESLLVAQKKDLQRVMELLSVSEQHARTLLIYHRWNVEGVQDVLVEKGKDQLLTEAGVVVVEHKNFASQYSSSSVIACTVCMEDVPFNEVTPMDCGHLFCNTCWTEHFIVNINEGKSRRIRCMVHKCYTICDEAVIRNLVSRRDSKLAERFDRFLLESYIEDNKMVKWCPSVPHCGNAVRVEVDVYSEVECSCGMQFCFSCLSDAHSPCSCVMWKLWMKKCKDDSETANYFTANTKPCPKCLKPVEKNGGCNLVRCICGQSFCWLCGGSTGMAHTWTSIEGHSCGRYKEDQEKKAELAKRDLYRYMHYFNRYNAHKESLKHEKKHEAQVLYMISTLEENNQYIDFSWVTKGFSRLFISRRLLSYSYPFAFYMFGEELFKDEMKEEERALKQNLFEDQQQQFEANVEKLSKLLEEKLSKFLEASINDNSEDKLMDTRMHVINMSKITDTMCKSMYECIETELLGSLKWDIHNIAPYKPNGFEKAIEVPVWMQSHC